MTHLTFTRDGLNCRYYPSTLTLTTSTNGTFDRAFEPTARVRVLTLAEHDALMDELDDVDPMAPDYEALGNEPLPLTAGADSRDSAWRV